MVDGEVEVLERRRKLELRGCDLVVARLRRDAEPPEAVLHLVHELEDARADRAEVVVVELLVLRRSGAEDGAAGLEQIGAEQVEVPVDEEILLFRAERDGDVRVARQTEMREEAPRRLREGLHGTEERRLGVQRLARVGAEHRGDAERRAVRMALDEGGARGVPARVAARLEGGAEAAGRETGGVRLAADEVPAAETLDGLRRTGRLQEGVVLLGRPPREGLEPVGEVRRPLRKRPVLHRVRHVVGDGGVERLAVVDGREQLGGGRLGQVRPDFLLAEDVLSVGLQGRVGRQGRHGRSRDVGGNRVDCVDAVIRIHGTG